MDWWRILLHAWGKILWAAIAIWGLCLLTFTKSGRGWLSDQWEWFKLFFINDDAHPEYPDHKNLVIFSITACFVVAFLRYIAYSNPEVFPNLEEWLLFFGGVTGIVSAASYLKLRTKMNAPGNGKPNDPQKPPEPKL